MSNGDFPFLASVSSMSVFTIPVDFFKMSTQSVVLQEPTRLRDSIIWNLQDQFYIQKGPSCWTDAIVPHFVTSNSYIAYQYANCILGYIRDYYSSYDWSGSVTVKTRREQRRADLHH